jgi:hypothetical protein
MLGQRKVDWSRNNEMSRTHSIVELTAPRLGNELITELADLGVKDETFEVDVSEPGDGPAKKCQHKI